MSPRVPASANPPAAGEREPLLADLPYRRNVGICLFNAAGLVWAGEVYANPHGWPDPEIFAPGADWSLPQGGIGVHASPDPSPRRLDDVDCAREIKAAGLRAAVHRHHHGSTAERSRLLSRWDKEVKSQPK